MQESTAPPPKRSPARSAGGTTRHRPDGRWEARYTLTEARGQSKQISIYGKSHPAVARALRAALAAKDRGAPEKRGKETVAAFVDAYLSSPHARNLRSLKRIKELLRLHVLPRLGGYRLTELNRKLLIRHFEQLAADGMNTSTVHLVYRVFRAVLSEAVKEDLIAANPARGLGLQRPRSLVTNTLARDQVPRLLEVADSWDYCLFLIALRTGMRLGELLALRWADVQLDGQRPALHVVRTLLGIRDYKPITGPTKTARSTRQVELTGRMVVALREQRERLHVAAQDPGIIWIDNDLVFPNRFGVPRRERAVTHALHAALDRAGLPRIRFHDLRHTAATLMLSSNIHPKIVADMLGHSTTAITLDTYSHVAPTLHREALESMETAWEGQTAATRD